MMNARAQKLSGRAQGTMPPAPAIDTKGQIGSFPAHRHSDLQGYLPSPENRIHLAQAFDGTVDNGDGTGCGGPGGCSDGINRQERIKVIIFETSGELSKQLTKDGTDETLDIKSTGMDQLLINRIVAGTETAEVFLIDRKTNNKSNELAMVLSHKHPKAMILIVGEPETAERTDSMFRTSKIKQGQRGILSLDQIDNLGSILRGEEGRQITVMMLKQSRKTSVPSDRIFAPTDTPTPRTLKSIKRAVFVGCCEKGYGRGSLFSRSFWDGLKGALGADSVNIAPTNCTTISFLLRGLKKYGWPDAIIIGPLKKPVTVLDKIKRRVGEIPRTTAVIVLDQRENNEFNREELVQAGATNIIRLSEEGTSPGSKLVDRESRCELNSNELAHMFRAAIDSTESHRIITPQGGAVKLVDEDHMDMSPEEAKQASRAMIAFIKFYRRYMLETGHFNAMYQATLNQRRYVGDVIVSVGCGEGTPDIQFLDYVIKSEYLLGDRALDEPIHLLLIDKEQEILKHARQEVRTWSTRLNREYVHLYHLFNIQFLAADATDPTFPASVNNALNEMGLDGIDDVDTVIASFLISWVARKRAFVQNIANIIPSGAIVLPREESPELHVGPDMKKYDPTGTIAEGIRKAVRQIALAKYHKMIREYGFEQADEESFAKIDRFHGVSVLPFRKK